MTRAHRSSIGVPEGAIAVCESEHAPALSWRIITELGGASTEVALAADPSFEHGQDDAGRFWSAHAPESCFRLPSCTLPAGWYELTGTMECMAGAITLPTVHYSLGEDDWKDRQAILPAPGPDGVVRAMLLFLSPVTSLGFAPSIEPANFRMRDFRLRRLSRSAALKRMLGAVEQDEPLSTRLRRGMRFATHASRVGLSNAASTLYRDYLRRLRARALANYEICVPETTVEDPEREESERKSLGEAVAPYLINHSGLDGMLAIAAVSRRLEREYRLLAESGLFDKRYYLRNNPDVARSGLDPLFHFCQFGWRSLRNPNPDFDVWWYWLNHLDPAVALVNPLVHYALVGKQEGLSVRPAPPGRLDGGHVYPADARIRRVCLFAGYDAQGIIDDHVVDYLRELSRHADVYYLADGEMQPGQLQKIAGITKSAWAIRHKAYDFGSYSMLAKELVGWDRIEQYDELMLVNDSAYLLRSLDDVFARMDAKACDWWGLQATKGIFSTRHKESNRFKNPIPISEVKDRLLAKYEQEYIYDFLVGSYFLVFRSPVIANDGFRKLIDGVARQRRKLNIIRKYEIGITRYLIGSGHSFETFMDSLYPFHPIYSETVFDLVKQGFPLFKRYFLSQNHYTTPNLLNWKERLLQWVPDAPVEQMERNLFRASSYERLYRNLRIKKDTFGRAKPPMLLKGKAFERADAACEKHDNWWVFPTCAFTHTFSGNERAIFEAVKHDASIKKIILARKNYVQAKGENVVVVPLRSPEGQYYLMRAGQIFIKHTPKRNLIYPVSPSLHNLVNVWHGIPLKRIGYASLDVQHKLEALSEQHEMCRAVISSSKVDTMAMASAFYPLSYNDVWMTGLPRNDFILRDFDALPEDFREQTHLLRAMLGGKRLVLFVPTFKRAQEGGYYEFSEDELDYLRGWLERNNAVLGVREHMADKARTYFRMLSEIGAMAVDDSWFPNIEVLYREASLLITDYSSCFIDFMLTGKPMLSFAYDYDSYVNEERGLFYDLEFAFPGAICKDFDQLAAALDTTSLEVSPEVGPEYALKRELFFEYVDDSNANRVVERIKTLYRETPGQEERI